MSINKYLPKVLQDVLELQYITHSEDIELNNIRSNLNQLTKEVIIATATTDGITRWEKLFNISPSPTDSLDLRRFRVQSILLNKLPYTIRWVHKRLDEIVGPGNYSVEMSYEDYSLTITLSGLPIDMLTEVQRQFRNSVPANIVLLIGNEPTITLNVNYMVGLRYATHYVLEVEPTGI